jgi:two-component system, OmpR family, sensor histidine kinase VicK
MKIYLFSPVEKEFRNNFYHHIRLQNIKITGLISLVVSLTAFVVRVIAELLPQTKALSPMVVHELRIINTSLIVTSLVFALIIMFVRKKVGIMQQNRYHFLTLAYAVVIIGDFMALTFSAQHNPKNTMTMMLIGALCVAVLLVFTLRELLCIIALSMLTFTLFFHLFQIDPIVRVFNYIIFCEIMLCFFVISRLLYSYHANYFIKLKTIENKNEEIAQINQLKTEILGLVAHDLRNPIYGIRSVVQIMQEYESTPEQEVKYRDWILDAVNTAEQIIEELLHAAREQDGKKLQTNYISLNEWLSTVYDSWQQQTSVVPHRLVLELPPREIKAHVHTGKLQRVVDNLLHNAAKFTPENGEIKLGLRPHRGGVRIYVTDTGIGIPPELLPTLFDRFTPSRRVGLNNEPSTGLGLHICKQLVQQHGGNIHVNSQENRGTVFNIDLPLTVL